MAPVQQRSKFVPQSLIGTNAFFKLETKCIMSQRLCPWVCYTLKFLDEEYFHSISQEKLSCLKERGLKTPTILSWDRDSLSRVCVQLHVATKKIYAKWKVSLFFQCSLFFNVLFFHFSASVLLYFLLILKDHKICL